MRLICCLMSFFTVILADSPVRFTVNMDNSLCNSSFASCSACCLDHFSRSLTSLEQLCHQECKNTTNNSTCLSECLKDEYTSPLASLRFCQNHCNAHLKSHCLSALPDALLTDSSPAQWFYSCMNSSFPAISATKSVQNTAPQPPAGLNSDFADLVRSEFMSTRQAPKSSFHESPTLSDCQQGLNRCEQICARQFTFDRNCPIECQDLFLLCKGGL